LHKEKKKNFTVIAEKKKETGIIGLYFIK